MIEVKRIRMAKRPVKSLSVEDFTEETYTLNALREGEVRCHVRYISLDPYLAQMMTSWQGPERCWEQGIIAGRMVGQVIETRDPDFSVGDWVSGDSQWQTYEQGTSQRFRKVDVTDDIPGSAYLGVLGSSGLTAWIGIHRIIRIEAGETLTISSAAGSVGAIAGQLAKMRGARVVGLAGGQQKCEQVCSMLGFDACVDHHARNMQAQLAQAIDGPLHAHFENVGAKTLDPVLSLISDGGRIGLCGLIAHYLDDKPVCLNNFRRLLTAGITLQGFRIYDHFDVAKQAHTELRAGIQSGQILIRETLTEHIENAPAAYLNMLSSGGVGKHLIHIPA